MDDQHGKVWFITGSSVGLGKALAREVLDRGGTVVATARDSASVDDLAELAPDRVLAVALDVTRADQAAAAVESARQRFGRIDVLVNNAGYGFLSGLEEASDAEARAQFETNFFGLVAVTKQALPVMREQQSGTVVNISSTAGVFGIGGSAYYCASKFALEGLSEALAQELEPLGLRVLIVEPGPFRTEFFGRSLRVPAEPHPAYRHLADQRAAVEKLDGQQVGDPVRGARAIVDVVSSESPPLRMVLGRGAFERARAALERRIADIDRTREIAASADFPEG
jgi:NAD(P)-dependent dehydrogenase (short-subunit alcohol dehydrogenase family)